MMFEEGETVPRYHCAKGPRNTGMKKESPIFKTPKVDEKLLDI